MNYPESAVMRDQINAAQKILLSCHHHPDSDTVGSAVSLGRVLEDMGKTVKLICPDHIPPFLSFIEGSEKIETHKFEDFAFNEWDLFIVCDTSNWSRLFIDPHFTEPKIPVIVIDNHTSNKGFGEMSLLDYKTSSVCEMLCNIFDDWGVSITKPMATALLAGILGDTGSFQFEVFDKTFETADKLIKKGADISTINFHLFQSLPLELIKFWGVVINKLTKDETGFTYVAIPYDEYKDFVHIYGTRETAASAILSKIKDSTFSFIMTEEQPGSVSVSFRSRTGVDTSVIALQFGGGGHPAASGAWLRGMSFDEALHKVLSACKSIS